MKNVWSVMCVKSSIDRNTNSLSLFDTLEEIDVSYQGDIKMEQKKTVPISFEVISLWFDEAIKEEQKFNMLIESYDPAGQLMSSFAKDHIIETGKKRLRTVTRINGLNVTTAGIYHLRVKYRFGENIYIEVSDIPFDVKFTKQGDK